MVQKRAKRTPDTIVETTKSLLVSKNDKSSHICTMILEVVLAKYVKYGSLSIYNGCLKHFWAKIPRALLSHFYYVQNICNGNFPTQK